MTDIVWEDPPERRYGPDGRGSKWKAFADALREHPGKWAVASAGGTQQGAFGGLGRKLKGFGCETAQRKQPDGTFTLYARWLEDES